MPSARTRLAEIPFSPCGLMDAYRPDLVSPLEASAPTPHLPPGPLLSCQGWGVIIARKERKVNRFIHNSLLLQSRILAIKFSAGSADQHTGNSTHKPSIQGPFASLLMDLRLLCCPAFSKPRNQTEAPRLLSF